MKTEKERIGQALLQCFAHTCLKYEYEKKKINGKIPSSYGKIGGQKWPFTFRWLIILPPSPKTVTSTQNITVQKEQWISGVRQRWALAPNWFALSVFFLQAMRKLDHEDMHMKDCPFYFRSRKRRKQKFYMDSARNVRELKGITKIQRQKKQTRSASEIKRICCDRRKCPFIDKTNDRVDFFSAGLSQVLDH